MKNVRVNARRVTMASVSALVVTVMGASAAWAAVALPYTFTVSYISGGDNGVRTPEFLTNSTGKICVDPNLKNISNSFTAGYNDYRFYFEIWQAKATGDTKLITSRTLLAASVDTGGGDQPKLCYVNLPTSKTLYVRIKKTKFVTDQKLGGTGAVSYT